ncbi:DUF1990 family protein [Streptomyces sp. NBC_00083]|uniref:DUF1990 family protein n=1 Tax=Streptomyces sp. NBC_00083 TaxID=2975647 RepID=UPI0022586B55|nr:DUF1990 domain-containing protein [Streptomyces sp. NBC_00083]MCX5382698.1 DUF1990 domain-containing protein [Streptomyces sp. NBC_00083]
MDVRRDLRAAYERARASKPSYAEVGATGGPRMPGPENGYRVFRRRITVGYGAETFERAGAYVLTWGVQRGAGFGVYPGRTPTPAPPAAPGTPTAPGMPTAPTAPATPTAPGDTALVILRAAPFRFPRLVIPCRVVWTVRSAERIGFAYGTLPGHPECGEESFVVGREADGLVWFEVAAFSRPARWYARLGGPFTRLLQDLATRRYLRAVAAAAVRR